MGQQRNCEKSKLYSRGTNNNILHGHTNEWIHNHCKAMLHCFDGRQTRRWRKGFTNYILNVARMGGPEWGGTRAIMICEFMFKIMIFALLWKFKKSIIEWTLTHWTYIVENFNSTIWMLCTILTLVLMMRCFSRPFFTRTTRFTGSICILRDSSNVSFERIGYSFPYLENIKVNNFNIDENIPEEFGSCTILERVWTMVCGPKWSQFSD